MSDSTADLDLISVSQSGKETTANDALNAVSPAAGFGRRRVSSIGLTWGFHGIRLGATKVANGTVGLTASATNYVVVDRATLAVTASTTTTNWNDVVKYGRAYKVVTDANGATGWEDWRPAYGGILETLRLLQEIAYATPYTPDASLGERIVVAALTGALTINAPTNPVKGRVLTFSFLQDGTGGRVITWNAAFKKAADGAGTANQGAATQFIYDGANWRQIGGALTWA